MWIPNYQSFFFFSEKVLHRTWAKLSYWVILRFSRIAEQWQGIFQFNLFWKLFIVPGRVTWCVKLGLQNLSRFSGSSVHKYFFFSCLTSSSSIEEARLHNPYFSVHSQNRCSFCGNRLQSLVCFTFLLPTCSVLRARFGWIVS